MSDYPGLVLSFQLAHPSSIQGQLKVLCQDQIKDIYKNISIRSKAKTGPIQHLQPLILRLMRVSGNLADLNSVMMTMKLRKRRE